MDTDSIKVTKLSVQVRDKSRVNVFINGSYRFSLDITQVADLGVKVGATYSKDELLTLEHEGVFGKVYTRALEYTFTRPRSLREMRDYLYRKTRDSRTKTGEVKKGVSPELTERVYNRLLEKGYIDDEKFARFWVENRNMRKGSSLRKIRSELMAKGVDAAIIEQALQSGDRQDSEEILKIIRKKAGKYADRQKLVRYLVTQGFSFDSITSGLEVFDTEVEGDTTQQ